MVHGRKRARTSISAHSKRPIDKSLISIFHMNVSTTAQSTQLIVATFPCTVMGLRWDFMLNATTGALAEVYWLIVIVKQGVPVGVPGLGDGSTFYAPEENVLAFGVRAVSGQTFTCGDCNPHFKGQTKTMRKLQSGDQLLFVATSNLVTGPDMHGVVQFFCKS